MTAYVVIALLILLLLVTEVDAENNSTTVLMIPSDFVTLAKTFSQYLNEHAPAWTEAHKT